MVNRNELNYTLVNNQAKETLKSLLQKHPKKPKTPFNQIITMFQRLKEWIFGTEEKQEKPEKKPKKFEGITQRRKLLKVGNSYAVSIPPGWLKTHDIDPEEIEDLVILANDDIKILNPESEPEAMKKFRELMK